MSTRGDQTQQRGSVSTDSTPTPRTDHDHGSFPRGNPEMYVLEADDLEVGGSFLQALVDSQPSWRRAALCRDQPLAIFFPARGQSSKPALAICGPCPVKADCLAEALAEELDFGIRGGMTSPARVAARKAVASTNAERAA